MPTEEQIARECRRIREEGFTDRYGDWHPPWDDATEQKRAGAGARIAAAFLEQDADFFFRDPHLKSAQLEEQDDDYLAWLITKGLTR